MLKFFPFVFLILFTLFFVNETLWASEVEEERGSEQPLQEVFQTELVYPQEKGEVQVTMAPSFRGGEAGRLIEVPFTIEYGITDSWQVEVEWAAFVNRNPSEGAATRGIGDLEMGTKYSFTNLADWAFHVALGFAIGFPLGNINQELTEGFIEYNPFLIIAKDLPKLYNSQIFTQVGLGLVQRVKKHADPDDDEAAAHELAWNVGFFIPAGPLRLTAEFNWLNNEWNHDGEENQMYLTPGLVWDLPGSWEVGVGVPVGLNEASDDFRVITLLTYEFNLLREEK